MNSNDRSAADTLNRRHFIRNAATAAGAMALPASAIARQDGAESRLPESGCEPSSCTSRTPRR